MKNTDFLYGSLSRKIHQAYVIYLPHNSTSTALAQRCLDSCKAIQYSAELWPGFDGTGSDLVIPDQLLRQSWYRWLKVTDHQQSLAEIACSLSHISLWAKCMELDRPIVILEHDAVMVKPYIEHEIFNGLVYLGCQDQQRSGRSQEGLIPTFSAINRNWNFIHRAHAYAIDPAAARRLFSCVLSRGIYESADVMIRTDDVAIIQTGFFAYDQPGQTTIKSRKQA